jgi:anthranilate phosphoribosyltransferase
MSFTEAIDSIVSRNDLAEDKAFIVMNAIMEGQATDAQIAGLLTALRMKGETVEEITGFTKAIRAKALTVKPTRVGLMDTCGTGGDTINTFNISTTAAFVVAACDIPVAKHGNRGVSSKCGSADVLEALGVKINILPEVVVGCIDEIGIGFFFAPLFHAAMKYAGRARKEVGIRTVFNLLGPLANPAGAAFQLVGVPDPDFTELLAGVLLKLGAEAALVVHGAGGLDEISTFGPTKVTEVRDKKISTYKIDPEMLGLPEAIPFALRGGDPRENAEITLAVLKGEPGPRQDIVVANAAAALYIAKRVKNFPEGINLAREVIRSKEALRKLELLRRYTHNGPALGKGGREQRVL